MAASSEKREQRKQHLPSCHLGLVRCQLGFVAASECLWETDSGDVRTGGSQASPISPGYQVTHRGNLMLFPVESGCAVWEIFFSIKGVGRERVRERGNGQIPELCVSCHRGGLTTPLMRIDPGDLHPSQSFALSFQFGWCQKTVKTAVLPGVSHPLLVGTRAAEVNAGMGPLLLAETFL